MKQVLRTRKKGHILRLAGQQQGQAVVEYVLLLIVSISLLLAFKSSFKKLDDFMYQFMGGYISCLMEYGELPSKGVEDSKIDQHNPANGGGGKVCDSKFAGFTLASGRPPSSSNSGSASSSNSQSASANKNSSLSATQASTKKASESKAKDGANSNGSGSNRQNGSADSVYAKGAIKHSSSSNSGGVADGSSTAENGKVKVINQDESDAARKARLGDDAGRSSRRKSYDRSQYRAITGKELADIEKQNKTRRAPSAAILPFDDEGRLGPRKTIVNLPKIDAAAVDRADDSRMDFGFFMKWLIIAAMAIAIFMFFGSQVMSFMNSQEK